MTLKEAMDYRGENEETLADKIGVRAGEVYRWSHGKGLMKASVVRLQQLAVALDGGILITEEGAEVELYGGRTP